MHPEVLETASGACPICKMPLEPVRLVTVWSCPIHAVVTADQPGRCRICGRDFVQVTMSVTWTCGGTGTGVGRSADRLLSPTTCADGTRAVASYAPRPHGNHNPQHGGAFFMAPDNWHHLEGTYPRAGVFRLYLYDDYSRPLPRDEIRRVAASVVTDRSSPLTVAKNGTYLEGRAAGAALPARMSARVRFKPGEPEHQFDFAFNAYTADVRLKPDAAGTDAANVRLKADAAGADAASVRLKPDAPGVGGAVDQIRALDRQIADAIERRAFSEIWVPALEAKDLALTIEADAGGPPARRGAISIAVKDLVRAAWMLDTYGDLGNAEQIARAHTRFTAALDRLAEALAER